MSHFQVDIRNFPRNHYPVLKALYRVPAIRLAPAFAVMTADTVSVIGFGCGIAASALLVLGINVPALVLLHASMLLDYVDGEVARLRNQCSLHGAWLEVGLDKVQAVCLFGGLSLGAAGAGGDAGAAWAWGFGAMSAFFLSATFKVQRSRMIKNPLAEMRAKGTASRADSTLEVWIVAAWRETASAYVVWLWILSIALLIGGPLTALRAAAIFGSIRCSLEFLVGDWRARGIDRARTRDAARSTGPARQEPIPESVQGIRVGVDPLRSPPGS